MKRYCAVFLGLWVAVCGVHAGNLDDEYVRIFNLIQEADSLNSAQPQQALAKYREAQNALQSFRKEAPNWSPSIVSFRLDYLSSQIAALTSHSPGNVKPVTPTPATVVPAATPAPPPPSVATAPTPTAPATPAASADAEAQINTLREEVRQLQSDKGLLQAKLKEAFAAQPSQTDPRELQHAEERIAALQKENDLLKATVEMDKKKPETNVDPKALERAQQAVAAADQQLAAQKQIVSRLTLENQALQGRLEKAQSGEPTASLRAQNQLLERQITTLQAQAAAAGTETAHQSSKAQPEFAALDTGSAGAPTQAWQQPAASERVSEKAAKRIKELERERDELKLQLRESNSAVRGHRGKAEATRVQALEDEVATLKLRIEVDEARAVPYTTEELALFTKPRPNLPVTPVAGEHVPLKQLSPSAAHLIAEARKAFQAGQYDRAETWYAQALEQDPNNVSILTDLANIEVIDNHLSTAETHVKQALVLAPNSAYALSVLGRLCLSQSKYDDAVDAFSRAAKLEPSDAQFQNFLGLALSEKGLRGPAEAALRKAVELDPNYGEAHKNLAVVYISDQPPSVELARWHYQHALACGAPHDPKFERLLQTASTAEFSKRESATR